jgi:hypothetical protein
MRAKRHRTVLRRLPARFLIGATRPTAQRKSYLCGMALRGGKPGPLDDHVRQGRRYTPELAASVPLEIGDWIRDDLPDLLWPALVLALDGTPGALRFVRWQKAVQEDLAELIEPKFLGEHLDGRLTGLDLLVDLDGSAAESVRTRANDYGLLSSTVAGVISSYPDRPAAWLVPAELHRPGQIEIDLAVKAVLEAITDGHREALLKCLHIWSAVQAGTFSSDRDLIDLLIPYPNDSETRSRADTAIRASWGATKGVLGQSDPTRFDASIKWAKVFWSINSLTTRCIRRTERTDSERGDAAFSDKIELAPSDDEDPAGGEHLRQLAMDLTASYVEALDSGPFLLYDPEQREVHAGLVTRAAREVITVLGCPDLWCAEHGSPLTRTLTEIRIYLEWMALQDASIYRQFQEYGFGKAKLYRRVLEEVPSEARTPGYEGALETLERLSREGDVLKYRIVDTGDSFAGKSIRSMAEECGLLDLYRYSYYLASGVSHSEWWSVETHGMERCLNVFHRLHLIPSLTLNRGGEVSLARAWVDSLYSIINTSLSILNCDPDTVAAAFEWLNGADDEGNPAS